MQCDTGAHPPDAFFAPAQELGDLGSGDGLEKRSPASAGDLRDHLAEATVTAAPRVGFGADALGGRYSGGRGCRGFPFFLPVRLREGPTPVVPVHRGLDGTAQVGQSPR